MKKLSLFFLMTALIVTGLFAEDKKKGGEAAAIAAKLTKFEGTVPAQWRIIWTGDASTQAIISWSTAEEGKSHTVFYGTSDNKADTSKYKNKQDCQRNGKYTVGKKDGGATGYYHHATIKDLKPSTTYFFVLKSDENVSKTFYFITAPDKGTGFSVIHGGDSRSGHLARCKVNMMIADMAAKDKTLIGFIHGGDYIGSGRSWKQWRLWLSQHELTTCPDGRILPIIPARGNHDGGPMYKEIFNIASDHPDWHTATLGKDVAVVTLDTNKPGGGDQVKWLEEELKRLRPQTTWLLTQYHRPLYPAVKGPPSHTKIFPPVFDKYNVDLACESDGHCIKRTVPIRAGKKDPTGVTYIGEGGLGVGQRKVKSDRWYLQGGVSGSEHHVMRLDFTPETLRIRTILLDRKIFDDHSLNVRK